jgi:hypothetical protein
LINPLFLEVAKWVAAVEAAAVIERAAVLEKNEMKLAADRQAATSAIFPWSSPFKG